jgi:hydroxylamine dehydrogenase
MEEKDKRPSSSLPRVLIIGLFGVIVVMGLILVFRITSQPAITQPEVRPNALAESNDACVECHRNATPGIVEQFGTSTMAAADVICSNCHVVEADYPGAVEHEGDYILASPTSAKCKKCHEVEVAQYNQSRHSIPAWVAAFGSEGLNSTIMQIYESIPEGLYAPNKERNAIAALEGKDITRFACEVCHSIGEPAADDSVGKCQKCHLRHKFSLEQARKPETCNACHIGPDHPQWEIYVESPHGISYHVNGQNYNWDADPGTLTVSDFPAPTCAICHFSGFGGTGTTHDVGERLTWYLFSAISERRPSWQDNKVRMQSVCLECHNQTFIESFYADADKGTESVNGFVTQGNQILKPLYDQGLISTEPFSEPIQYEEFELWHHWGRTAKFGMWMQGPDYTQWHGAYEMLKALSEIGEIAKTKLSEAGK